MTPSPSIGNIILKSETEASGPDCQQANSRSAYQQLESALRDPYLVTGGLCLVVALACLVNPHPYYLYLIDIFSLPLLWVFIGVAIVLAVLRKVSACGLAVVAVAVMMVAIWPQAFAAQPAADMTVKPVRLMFANLFMGNKAPQKIVPWIQAEKPDIIAVVERNGISRTVLSDALAKDYPYRYNWQSESENALYSRYPIEKALQLKNPGNYLAVRITTPNGPLTVLVTHLGHPGHGQNWIQKFQLSLLDEALTAADRRTTVLVGDFNSDLSGYLLSDFARKYDLNPLAARVGTWPSVLPAGMRIGIDNAFAGQGLSLSQRRVGPHTGSDHRPIVFDIRPAKGG